MEAKVWLFKVIRMRRKIIAIHRSHKGKSGCDFLERYLKAYNYSERTFASFFIRHSDKIYAILPGKGFKARKKFENDFARFLDECHDKARIAHQSNVPL